MSRTFFTLPTSRPPRHPIGLGKVCLIGVWSFELSIIRQRERLVEKPKELSSAEGKIYTTKPEDHIMVSGSGKNRRSMATNTY